MNRNSNKHVLAATFLAMAPLLVYWMLVEYTISPPFWHGWHHWELTLYYTSMDLVDGLPVHISSGPATPVQLLGALVLKAIGTNPADYPVFLGVVRSLTLLLCALAVFIFQRIAFDRSSLALSVACIWFYFSFGAALTFLQVWTPEALYFPVGMVFLAALVRMLDSLPEVRDLHILLAGLLLGLLIAVKFNMLPWVPAFVAVLLYLNLRQPMGTPVKALVLGGLATLSSFLLFTRPVSSNYDYMVKFLLGMALTDGISQPGEKTMISPTGALENWWAFAGDTWPSILFLLLVPAAVVWHRKLAGHTHAVTRRQVRAMLLFAIVGTLFSLATISRLYAPRYMLPVGLCGLLACAAAARLSAPHLSRTLKTAVLGLSFALLFVAMSGHLGKVRSHTAEVISANALLQSAIDRSVAAIGVEDPVIIYGWPLPHPVAAMRHQPYYEVHQRALDGVYPNTGYHVSWRNYVRIPSGARQWHLAVFPEFELERLRNSNIPIFNDLESSAPVGFFDAFEVMEKVGDFVILVPAEGFEPPTY